MKFEELTDWIEYNVLTNGMERVQARVVHGTLQAKDVNGVYHNWDLPHNYLLTLDFEETEFKPKEGQGYYYPNIGYKKRVAYKKWCNSPTDKRINKFVGRFRTREEAEVKANELWGE